MLLPAPSLATFEISSQGQRIARQALLVYLKPDFAGTSEVMFFMDQW